MSNAPICHVPPPTPNADTPVQPLPAIPNAVDLKSALAAIHALSQIVNILTGRQNLTNIGNVGGANNAVSQWTEVKAQRVTETIRVFNPTDHSQFVDVERINALTFKDGKSGQAWKWNR